MQYFCSFCGIFLTKKEPKRNELTKSELRTPELLQTSWTFLLSPRVKLNELEHQKNRTFRTRTQVRSITRHNSISIQLKSTRMMEGLQVVMGWALNFLFQSNPIVLSWADSDPYPYPCLKFSCYWKEALSHWKVLLHWFFGKVFWLFNILACHSKNLFTQMQSVQRCPPNCQHFCSAAIESVYCV